MSAGEYAMNTDACACPCCGVAIPEHYALPYVRVSWCAMCAKPFVTVAFLSGDTPCYSCLVLNEMIMRQGAVHRDLQVRHVIHVVQPILRIGFDPVPTEEQLYASITSALGMMYQPDKPRYSQRYVGNERSGWVYACKHCGSVVDYVRGIYPPGVTPEGNCEHCGKQLALTVLQDQGTANSPEAIAASFSREPIDSSYVQQFRESWSREAGGGYLPLVPLDT